MNRWGKALAGDLYRAAILWTLGIAIFLAYAAAMDIIGMALGILVWVWPVLVFVSFVVARLSRKRR